MRTKVGETYGKRRRTTVSNCLLWEGWCQGGRRSLPRWMSYQLELEKWSVVSDPRRTPNRQGRTTYWCTWCRIDGWRRGTIHRSSRSMKIGQSYGRAMLFSP